ncbi:hypothetical protein BKA66DRAFT_577393 [Pyrenochaeta sp. MPI-SDFR-AT-0127]|nr:hypothetical protein BKA66DRAFT_577393 [Pyrenochaeta sp. MPI-SDFR-AT-0127]
MEPFQNGGPPLLHATTGGTNDSNGLADTNANKVTRAGVQVSLKKMKRQFAHRTKTGCGTCRKRRHNFVNFS